MEFIFPILVIFAFFIGSFVVMTLHLRRMSARRALPSREDYRRKNGGKSSCRRCGAESTREFGLDGENDACRVVACIPCRLDLYQCRRGNEAA